MDKLTSNSTIFHSFLPPLLQISSFKKIPKFIYHYSGQYPLISDQFNDLGKLYSLNSVKQMHTHVIKLPKVDKFDEIVMNLISNYLRLCEFESALMVFYTGFGRNFMLWRWFLEEFRDFGGDPIEIIRVFGDLHRKGCNFDNRILTIVLKISAILMEKWVGVEVHSCIIKKGFDLDVYLKCALMNFYGQCWGTDYAHQVFDEMPVRDAMLWNEVVVAAIQNDKPMESLELFRDMQFSLVRAENFTIAKALQACGRGGALDEGRQIHGYVFRNYMFEGLVLCNSLIKMYSKNNKVELARKVFDSVTSCNVSTWNSMISAYASLGYFDEALELFDRMVSYNVIPDVVTWNCLLSSHVEYGLFHHVLVILHDMVLTSAKPESSSITAAIQAVSELKLIKLGKELHGYILRNGLDCDLYVQTTLLDMYIKTNELVRAHSVFNLMKTRNIVAWNSLIAGYSAKGLFDDAVVLFNQMEKEGVAPDIVTWNSLLSGYSLNGRLKDALAVVDKMAIVGMKPNVISWTSLISGSSQNGKYKDSIYFFSQMLEQGVKPNSATISSVLQALAGMSLLMTGKEVHCWCIRNVLYEDVSVGTAIVQMYIKSGSLQSASEIFQKLKNKTVATWNCMIMGFSVYNHGKEGIMLFNQMRDVGVHPDAITFTALLSCCKNSGLLDEGWKYFDSMKADYNVVPRIEHYSCMVDLLGRARYLDEAWYFIQTMPVKPDASVWGSLLQSCRLHSNLHLGKIAANNLFELEPNNTANYVIMMNMYSASSGWEDVKRLRLLMDDLGIRVQLGWSWIQINRKGHVFTDEAQPHPEIGSIYFELYQLVSEMKKAGYIPDVKSVYQDIDDIEKEKTLLTHTEKLAITYGLMKTKNGSPIRVIKSARMCSDCHNAAKFMSLVRNRDIILKDGVRFHHFYEGRCSCKDCW